MKEISANEIKGIRIGQTEDAVGGTGCTVLICPEGMKAGLDVRGGGPASRESKLLDPLTAAAAIHGIVLAGGSAFGLGAADGVMAYLEEHDIGYDVGVTKVPLVAQADIFDLTVADKDARPDKAMGYEAARLAMEEPNYRDGNHGAGCGATVGKHDGMDTCMKSGIGSYFMQIEDLIVGAIVVVNAFGDIFDWKTGKKIAGLLSEDGKGFRSTEEAMKVKTGAVDNRFSSNTANGAEENNISSNTTLGVVITNAGMDKTKLCKIAGMAHDGMARSIRPVHTTVDGDSIYAVSIGHVDADQDAVGTLAAEAVSEAITRAVMSAGTAYGFPAAKDI